MITLSKKLTALVLMVCLSFTIGNVRASAANTHTFGVEGTFDYDEANEVFKILNELRASRGLPALTQDASLTTAAMQRAAEISVYLSHSRPNGEVCSTAVTSSYTSMGENIAGGQYNAANAMNSWTVSSGHYDNMVDSSYTAVGIGCFYQENGEKFWVQLFTGASSPIRATVSGKVNGMKQITALESLLDLTIGTDNSGSNLSSLTMTVGNSQQLNLYANRTKITPLYSSSNNTNVATLSASGTLSADGIGDATVKLGLSTTFYKELTVTNEEATPTKQRSASVYSKEFPFKDVATNAWYRNAVELVYQYGWFSGTSDTEFSPNAQMTAAMMANVLYHMAGDPAVRTSNSEWYAKPMTWAQASGILSGIPEITHDTIVTREQMAVMMYNYINTTGNELITAGATANYSDSAKISNWASKAVATMYDAGILSGRADGTFDPQGTATRAEVSQMFANFSSAIAAYNALS